MSAQKPFCKVSLAPLQGITDYHFRNAFYKHFNGLNEAYTPFLRLHRGFEIKRSQIKDILPENNESLKIIPQILTNSEEEFIFLSKYLFDYGYQEINWNLGCPFPMVTKRQMGSGLLPYPEKIHQILEKTLAVIPNKVSIKLRLGYESEKDIFNVLPVLEDFPLTELIIHARVGKQMYKGEVNKDIFEKCIAQTRHKLAFNGDINSLEAFEQLNNQFKNINNWMIGRSAISNPFLIEEIKMGQKSLDDKLERFSAFHYELYDQITKTLSGPGHILSKMTHLWEYFSQSFSNSRKVLKKIKKSNTIDKFEESLHQIFNEEEWLA